MCVCEREIEREREKGGGGGGEEAVTNNNLGTEELICNYRT